MKGSSDCRHPWMTMNADPHTPASPERDPERRRAELWAYMVIVHAMRKAGIKRLPPLN